MKSSTGLSALQSCARLAPSTPIVGGAAYCFDGGWTPESAQRLLEQAVGQIQDPNRIELYAPGARSNQAVALSLHQEDYHLEVRPRLLALLCLETDVKGGETIVSSLDPESIPEGLRGAQIRFFRHSVGEWTPWRPVLEVHDGRLWPRIALPDVHRIVEVSFGQEALTAWFTRLEADAEPVSWAAGTLLIIDNRISVHGRRAMSGNARSLMRWVL